uniref:PBPb domain-containing protein n=1 Tax=Strongyloides stercoralis TaxID=6248 RepID=A0AAF5CZF1_STRER
MNNYTNTKAIIRVGVFPLIPDAYNCFYKMPNEECDKPGFEMEVLSIILKILNWNWTVIDVQNVYNISFSSNIFGKKIPNTNNFTGLLGLLKNDLIDIAIPSMRITEERLDACIFTHPISYIKQLYIIKRPNDYFNINFITETLDNFETIAIVLRQPVPIHSKISWNFFQIIFIISFLVFYNYFQSSMNSKLIAPQLVNLPFSNQKELVKLLEAHKTYLTYYDDSIPICTLPKNCQRLKVAIKDNPIKVHKDQDGLKDEINKGGVYFGTYDVDFFSYPTSIWSESDNFIAIMDPDEISTLSSFAFNKKKLRERNRFNEVLTSMLRGIKTIATAGKYYTKKQPFSVKISSKNLNNKSLDLSHNLRKLFETFVLGVIISIAILIVELIINRFLVQYNTSV